MLCIKGAVGTILFIRRLCICKKNMASFFVDKIKSGQVSSVANADDAKLKKVWTTRVFREAMNCYHGLPSNEKRCVILVKMSSKNPPQINGFKKSFNPDYMKGTICGNSSYDFACDDCMSLFTNRGFIPYDKCKNDTCTNLTKDFNFDGGNRSFCSSCRTTNTAAAMNNEILKELAESINKKIDDKPPKKTTSKKVMKKKKIKPVQVVKEEEPEDDEGKPEDDEEEPEDDEEEPEDDEEEPLPLMKIWRKPKGLR